MGRIQTENDFDHRSKMAFVFVIHLTKRETSKIAKFSYSKLSQKLAESSLRLFFENVELGEIIFTFLIPLLFISPAPLSWVDI